MKISLFIAFALLTGWISTSSLDTQKRLKKIEAQQSATLKQMDENLVKLANLINDANFEAQQAKVIADNNNDQLRAFAPVISNINAATDDNLIQLQRIEEAIKNADRSTKQSALLNTPPRTSPDITPSFPRPHIDVIGGHDQRMRERDASNAARALEGIRDELMWKNAKDAIK